MSLTDVDPLTFVLDGLDHLPKDPAHIDADELELLLDVVNGATRHAWAYDDAYAQLLDDMRTDPLATYGDLERRKALHRWEESLWLGLCVLERYTRRAFAQQGFDLAALAAHQDHTTPKTEEHR